MLACTNFQSEFWSIIAYSKLPATLLINKYVGEQGFISEARIFLPIYMLAHLKLEQFDLFIVWNFDNLWFVHIIFQIDHVIIRELGLCLVVVFNFRTGYFFVVTDLDVLDRVLDCMLWEILKLKLVYREAKSLIASHHTHFNFPIRLFWVLYIIIRTLSQWFYCLSTGNSSVTAINLQIKRVVLKFDF